MPTMAGMNIFEALRVSHEMQRALSARLLASAASDTETAVLDTATITVLRNHSRYGVLVSKV